LYLYRVGHGDGFLRPETLLFRSIGNAPEEREDRRWLVGPPHSDGKGP